MPDKAKIIEALDSAFYDHVKTLFEFATNNTSVNVHDGSHIENGLRRALEEYKTFSDVVAKI